jgi:hypothetical protein
MAPRTGTHTFAVNAFGAHRHYEMWFDFTMFQAGNPFLVPFPLTTEKWRLLDAYIYVHQTFGGGTTSNFTANMGLNSVGATSLLQGNNDLFAATGLVGLANANKGSLFTSRQTPIWDTSDSMKFTGAITGDTIPNLSQGSASLMLLYTELRIPTAQEAWG